MPTAPAAQRHRRPGWRDPRILVGLAILLGSVLLGARVLATADDSVAVWAVRSDRPAGVALTGDDLVVRRVRFVSSADADHYLSAEQQPPPGEVLRRPVGAGELLPRAALGPARPDLVQVPLSVESDEVPATVGEGSVVDVWVAPAASTTSDRLADATRVLHDVVVSAAPVSEGSLAPSGTRQVIVGVDSVQAEDLGPALGKALAGRVVLTKRG